MVAIFVGLIMMPIPVNNIITNMMNKITSRSKSVYLNLIRSIYNYINKEEHYCYGRSIFAIKLGHTINVEHKDHYKPSSKSPTGIPEALKSN